MPMTKPFDLADLVVRLKANGLDMVEKEAKDATSAILDWVQDSLLLQGGIAAAVAVPAVALVKPLLLKLENGIDGVSGN